jgi:hypothetical protein
MFHGGKKNMGKGSGPLNALRVFWGAIGACLSAPLSRLR